MENSQPDLPSETIDKNTIMQLMREIMEQEGRKIIAPMLEEKLLENQKPAGYTAKNGLFCKIDCLMRLVILT